MNDFEIKKLADHVADEGLTLIALGQQIRRATNEEDRRQMIAKAVNESAKAHRLALDMNSACVTKDKLVGVANDD